MVRKNPVGFVFLIGLAIVFCLAVAGGLALAGVFDEQETNAPSIGQNSTSGIGGLFKAEIVFIPPTKEGLDRLLIDNLARARNNTTVVDSETVRLLGGDKILSFVLTPERRSEAIQLRDGIRKVLDDMNTKYNIDSAIVFTEKKQADDIRFLINDIVKQTMKFESLSRLLNTP